MIQINLQLFGGGSSGSDGLAAAQNNGSMKQTTKKEYSGSAGSSGKFSSGVQKPQENSSGTARSSSEYITYQPIKEKQVYSMYRVDRINKTEKYEKDMQGIFIIRGELSYDKNEQVWRERRTGRRYRLKLKK